MKLESRELKAIGLSAALVLLNIGLMMVFSTIEPLMNVFDLVWEYLILGVIAYAALLMGGAYIAKRGIRQSNIGLAVVGTAVLQFAYGTFGAGIINVAAPESQAVILGVTAVITTAIAVSAALYVYWTDRDLRFTGKYSNYAFLGVFLFALVGTFIPVLAIPAFFFALAGFLLYLIYEVWEMKTTTKDFKLAGIGIYIAYAGVFIHVLQLVARHYLDE